MAFALMCVYSILLQVVQAHRGASVLQVRQTLVATRSTSGVGLLARGAQHGAK
jgi:hypothetical protein